jgi:hypothetical protein
MIKLLLATAGLLLLALRLPADPADAAIDADMSRLGTAMLQNDIPTLVDMMYAPVVSQFGGRQVMIDNGNKLMLLMAQKSARLVSIEFPKPYRRIAAKDHDYVIIPDHMVMQYGPHHIDTRSFQLGIRNHSSATWQYLTGTQITPQVRDQLFPDFPKDVAFPPPQQRQID